MRCSRGRSRAGARARLSLLFPAGDGAPGLRAGAGRAARGRRGRRLAAARPAWCSATAGSMRDTRRCRRCSPSPPCTSTSCGAACGSAQPRGRGRRRARRPPARGAARLRRGRGLPPSRAAGDRGNRGRRGRAAEAREEAERRYRAALDKGLLKILSKMGISTLRSYRGAQLFEAVGVSEALVARHFTGTPSSIGGIGLPEVAAEVLARHRDAFGPDARRSTKAACTATGSAAKRTPTSRRSSARCTPPSATSARLDYRAYADLVQGRAPAGPARSHGVPPRDAACRWTRSSRRPPSCPAS